MGRPVRKAGRFLFSIAPWATGTARGRVDVTTMLQYRVYLLAELGKLRARGDAEFLLERINDADLAALGLEQGPVALTAQFRDQVDVAAYVDGLDATQAVALTGLCSRARRNDVAVRLAEPGRWEIIRAPAADVEIAQAEPALADIWRRHGYRLSAIARDPDVLSSHPYSQRQANIRPAYDVLLASRHGASYRVFDGVHRAIQLVRNGELALTMCVPEADIRRG